MRRWLIPLACVFTLAGYFSPWVNHQAAGLVITGLDLGEYVKFIPAVRRGEIGLWRPGFYAPLVVVSAAALLAAYRRELAYPGWMRAGLLLVAIVSALNLLPPAWTPPRLLEPEFRWQTGSLVTLLAGIGLSPFLGLLPRPIPAVLVTVLVMAGLGFPLQGFWAIVPAVSQLLAKPVAPAWGLWLTVSGLVALAAAWWLPGRITRLSSLTSP